VSTICRYLPKWTIMPRSFFRFSNFKKTRIMNRNLQRLPRRSSTPAIFIARSLSILWALFLIANGRAGVAGDIPSLTPTVQLTTPDSRDQDDMCVWIHPTDKTRSMIVTSDKSAGHIFVYDLEGQLLQTLDVPKPGNIDVRQNVVLEGRSIDIIAVNQRTEGFKLVIYQVDPDSRQLIRIDDNCATGPNYGGCLYFSSKTRRLFFVCTSDAGTVEQYELLGNKRGGVKATKVRTLKIGKCEGAVADDDTGSLYISEEQRGVWKFGAEPDDSSAGTLIAPIGEHGIKGDLEGLALYKIGNGNGYLLVSDQGHSRFAVFQREEPHRYVGDFAIEGASETDGIEVVSTHLGLRFPEGLFACHTNQPPRAVQVTSWANIAARLSSASSPQ
jgi:3-phytase